MWETVNAMKYLLVLVCCFLGTAKVTFQSAFSKKAVRTLADTVLFNCLIFASTSLLFLPDLGKINLGICLYSLLFAVFTVLFQVSYTLALSMGNVSMSVMLANLSMIMPLLTSIIFFNEPLSPLRLVGILLTVCSFITATDFKTKSKSSAKWLLISILAMLTNGSAGVVQKIFGMSQYAKNMGAFISSTYLFAAIIAGLVYLFLHLRGEKKTFKKTGEAIKYALLTGISLSVFQGIYNYAIRTVDGTFFFPSYSGSAILFSTVAGLILFKDRLKKNHIVSLILGTLAIVLVNF